MNKHPIFMKYVFLFIFNVMAGLAFGQHANPPLRGSVSYISSQNVYVKFESTQSILPGDTLFIKSGEKFLPALIVENKSSISCVCSQLDKVRTLKISDPVFQLRSRTKEPDEMPETKREEQTSAAAAGKEQGDMPSVLPETPSDKLEPGFEEQIHARFSIASYNNFSESRKTNVLKYTLSFRGNNLGNSRVSLESHMIFRHLLDRWDEVKENLNNALKIYSLSVSYDFNERSGLSVGRKINPRISSMGAIDGIHFESGFGNFYAGAIAGFRPDYVDYGLNVDLPQFGIYAGHESAGQNKFTQTTLAFIEQRNGGETDRRFVYLQHSGSIYDLYLFVSSEISLYEKIAGEASNTLNLDNLYLLARYRLSRKFNVSASYDNRKNVIYYESYKNFIDRLLEEESRQGIRFQMNYLPVNHVRMGINTGWRYQKDNLNMAKNLGAYLGFDRISNIRLRTYLNADFLQTNYIESRNFGIRFSKEIMKGRLSGDIYYRNVVYQYRTSESSVRQHILGMNFSFRIIHRLSFYMGYEGIAESPGGLYNRLNFQVTQRL